MSRALKPKVGDIWKLNSDNFYCIVLSHVEDNCFEVFEWYDEDRANPYFGTPHAMEYEDAFCTWSNQADWRLVIRG